MHQHNVYIDRVIAVDDPEQDEARLRLADETPHGGYTALLDAADEAGLGLTEYGSEDVVAVAAVTDDGDVVGFWPEGRKVFKIGAQDVDDPHDAGFNVFFDRSYDYRFEAYPVEEDAAVRAIEESYGWGHAPEEMEEGEPLGVLVADGDGNYVDIHLTR